MANAILTHTTTENVGLRISESAVQQRVSEHCLLLTLPFILCNVSVFLAALHYGLFSVWFIFLSAVLVHFLIIVTCLLPFFKILFPLYEATIMHSATDRHFHCFHVHINLKQHQAGLQQMFSCKEVLLFKSVSCDALCHSNKCVRSGFLVPHDVLVFLLSTFIPQIKCFQQQLCGRGTEASKQQEVLIFCKFRKGPIACWTQMVYWSVFSRITAFVE